MTPPDLPIPARLTVAPGPHVLAAVEAGLEVAGPEATQPIIDELFTAT